ncbi:restriction endonuclease subunit S [Actinomadura scrupuli]|uniref:restriction endonuclease subunit S n=1 Tax=Actinomadura scrupuli TaxID=559629 RepID=UPI003D96D743
MPEWPKVPFVQLAAQGKSSFSIGPFGSAITKENYVAHGVPVVRGINLARGIFHDDEFVYITEGKADELANANLAPGDLVFTHRGTIGQVSMIPRVPRFSRYVLSSSQVKARLDESLTIPEFYFYWFRSPVGQHTLLANASTVGVPGIGQPLATIKSLKVPCPPRLTQEGIATVLGALNDKIAVNNRIVNTNRELSLCLYRRSIFNEFKQSTIGQAVTFHNKSRVPLSSRQRKEFQGPYPYYGANGIVDHVAEYRFDGDYILVGEDGSVVTKNGSPVVRHAHGQFWVSNHAHVLSGDAISNELLHCALRDSDVRPYVTGAVQPKLSMGNLKKVSIILPLERHRLALEAELGFLASLALIKSTENQSLAELRDTLLPKLMSGEIKVRDAEKAVEEAV